MNRWSLSRGKRGMRVAVNLMTDHPDHPSGAHWSMTRAVEAMLDLLEPDEEVHLMVGRRMLPLVETVDPRAGRLVFPWSNEHRVLRTISEHAYVPIRLPLAGIDVFNTLFVPIVRAAPRQVAHIRSMHAFAEPGSLHPAARLYRRLSYPRTARVADALILNSESLRSEVQHYLDVDPAKLHMVPEAVDHDLFRPGDPDEARCKLRRYGVDRPFVLFVSSLWPYKNADGLLRAFAGAGDSLAGHQLVIVGAARDNNYRQELASLTESLGVADRTVWVGAVPHHETVDFYRAADVFVYPSFNETFGLPLLEAMAAGCPVVTSDVTSMPEIAGDGALVVNPYDPEAIADAIVVACGDEGDQLRKRGQRRAQDFTWTATAQGTLDVYRAVHRAGR